MKKKLKNIWGSRKSLMIASMLVCFICCSLNSCGKEDPIELPKEEKPDASLEKDKNPLDDTDGSIIDPSDIQDYDKIYKPIEFKEMDWLNDNSKWSFKRSKQSEHFIVLWEKGFGDNPNGVGVPEALRVDIGDLLKKAEIFYEINVNKLKFLNWDNFDSNISNYKMQIYLFFQNDWMAYGSGYDDVIGALWISPSTCKPIGSTIAHEIGHCFQYQIYADLLAARKVDNDFSRGFRYGYGGNGGNTFWEQTAQWQSFHTYPNEIFESYNFKVYIENYHRHICHEWQRYASYFIHYYWTFKHGEEVIGKLWRESRSPEDALETYMRINQLELGQFYEELFEASVRFVTWDLDVLRLLGEEYIGKQTSNLFQLNDGSYQVAYSSCPGTTGYNVIPLNVPEVGTTIECSFQGLNPGSQLAANDPGISKNGEQTLTVSNYNKSDTERAGWRYGFVALLSTGERVYGKMNTEKKKNVIFTIPANCKKIWFVVLGAPTSYNPHVWDEDETNDEQWPYTVKFSGTDILGNIVIDPNETPEDVLLTYDISFPADTKFYSGENISLMENGDISKIAKAFKIQSSNISELLLAPGELPQEGKIAFGAIEPTDKINYHTTANGHGFWFDSNGNVVAWGDVCMLFAEFTSTDFLFSIGQFPSRCTIGDKFTIKVAFIYTHEGKQYNAILVFNVTIT